MSPIGKHWLKFAYINLGFFTVISIMVYYISIKEVQNNWSKYRCNPLFMPFSKNISDDFAACITSVQNTSMDRFLGPISGQLADNDAVNNGNTNRINAYGNSLNSLTGGIDGKISGINDMFSNGSVEFQRMAYGIKDMMSKIVGISTTLLYVLEGNAKTFGSMWNGPPGKTMRKLALLGHCFHPDTKLKLKSGETVLMRNIQIGSILEDGSKVTSTMQIINNEPLMKVKTSLPNESPSYTYVTGSHLIKSTVGMKFIKVKDHPESVPQNTIKSDWYSCLITDSHLIKIGSRTFWDWEDYYCKFV